MRVGGKGKMARLLKKAGDFVIDVAAQQYKRSMTRKLNAFGETIREEKSLEMFTHEHGRTSRLPRRACATEVPQQRLHARPPPMHSR